jgi:hypothetical protein
VQIGVIKDLALGIGVDKFSSHSLMVSCRSEKLKVERGK